MVTIKLLGNTRSFGVEAVEAGDACTSLSMEESTVLANTMKDCAIFCVNDNACTYFKFNKTNNDCVKLSYLGNTTVIIPAEFADFSNTYMVV